MTMTAPQVPEGETARTTAAPPPSGDGIPLGQGSGSRPGALAAVWVHAWRVLRVWATRSDIYVVTFVAPLVFLYIVYQLFGGFIRQLTGDVDMNAITMLVVVSWSFITVITGSATVVMERDQGLYARFATLPNGFQVVVFGRVLAEFCRTFLMALLVEAVSLSLTSFDLVTARPWAVLAVTALVSICAASVGVLIAFSISTPQGAVAIIPLIVVMLFINTALLPGDRYAPALRGIAEHTPVTAAVQFLIHARGAGATRGDLLLLLGWFAGATVLCWAVLLLRRPRTV